MRIFGNSHGHHISPTANFQYTFDREELDKAIQQETIAAIVHHGDMPTFNNHILVHSHVEGLILFTSGASGASSITSEDLASILSGRIVNWREVGGNDVPIELGVRADGVFMRSSQAILKRSGLQLSAKFSASHSYGDLAAFACRKPGALVIGLRGPFARNSMLTELQVDGARVGRSNAAPYPLAIRVSLLLRRGNPLASELGRGFAESLVAGGREDRTEAEAFAAASELLEGLDAMGAEQRTKEAAFAQ